MLSVAADIIDSYLWLVQAVFATARAQSPSILFVDDIDSLVRARSLGSASNGGYSGLNERVLTTLLNELDGVDAKHHVVFVAATSNVGVLDKVIYTLLLFVLSVCPSAHLTIFRLDTTRWVCDF